VLKGVSVTACGRDVISMIGSSGSGKSTFLHFLNLLEQPNEGRIEVGGEALDLIPDRHGALKARDPAQLQRLRSQVAMVFQHFNLWAHTTAPQNVIEAPMQVLGLSRAEAVERAENYLRRVGVIHRKDAYPAHLSGGEQQRVAIARAGDGAQGHAVRRADIGARPRTGGRGAARDALGGRRRPHDDRRHA